MVGCGRKEFLGGPGDLLKMRFLFFLVTICFVLMSMSPPLLATSNIEVRIVPHSRPEVTSSSIITVTVTNVGEGDVFIPKPLSPFYVIDNHMTTKLFDVVDSTKAEVSFIGRFIRMIPEDPDWYFLKIKEGHSLSQDVDLAKDYDLSSGGSFQISYRQGFARSVHTDARGQIDSEFEYQLSDVATIWIDPSAANDYKGRSVFLGRPLQGKQCDSVQSSTIRQAAARGWSVATDAIRGIESLYSIKKDTDSQGRVIYSGEIKNDNAYSYWFGAPDNTSETYFVEPLIVDYWKSNIDYVMMRFMNSIALRLGTGTFYCGCDSRYDERSAGWTDPSTRTVTLCNRFFRLKLTDGPYDSQVLTLLHELSHFVDSWGPGTGDYAYGMYPSHSLAQGNRRNAVKNADSIMYYMGKYVRDD